MLKMRERGRKWSDVKRVSFCQRGSEDGCLKDRRGRVMMSSGKGQRKEGVRG